MSPTQLQLLENAKKQDLAQVANNAELHRALVQAIKTGGASPIAGNHPSELDLTDEDEDPFGGNTNNRRVAERIAATSTRIYSNTAKPIHMGDPTKARADIAKSKRVNPEVAPIIEELDDATLPKRTPSPGSPAAAKAADKAPAAPAVWKPNA